LRPFSEKQAQNAQAPFWLSPFFNPHFQVLSGGYNISRKSKYLKQTQTGEEFLAGLLRGV
jgi:hypothetical protein